MRTIKEAEGMRERGYGVYFAASRGGLLKEARARGFTTYTIRYKKIFWPISFFKIIKIIIEERIDIVNTHSSEDSWLGGMVARLLRKRIIRTRHLSTPIKEGINSYLLFNWLTDFVVTTCKDAASKIVAQSGIDKRFCISIPTGVEVEKVFSNIEKKPSTFLVGTACFMRSWKGIEDFIYAADSLRDEDIRWVIIGGGHSKKYIELVKELSLGETVFFTGHLDNPYNAIASLDIFLLLSTAHEGVSQASLQAAYLEKPIIGTAVGGIPEICIDGVTGVIVPTGSPKKVAEAVMELRSNREERERMGRRAKDLVLKRFTYKAMLDKMEDVYKTVLGYG